jgi:hypothetical protein
MTRSHYLLLSLITAIGLPLVFVAFGYFLRFLPVTRFTFKIPNRDYWIAPERRDETFTYLFHHFLWLACLEAIFMSVIELLVIQANHQTPAHLSTPLALGIGACFIVATVIWIGVLFRHFNRIAFAPSPR